MATRSQLRRYNLVLPQQLYDELEAVAQRKQTSVVEILRKFIRLGLLAIQLEDKPGAAILIRDGGTTQEVRFL